MTDNKEGKELNEIKQTMAKIWELDENLDMNKGLSELYSRGFEVVKKDHTPQDEKEWWKMETNNLDSNQLSELLINHLKLGDYDNRELAHVIELASNELACRMRYAKDYSGIVRKKKKLVTNQLIDKHCKVMHGYDGPGKRDQQQDDEPTEDKTVITGKVEIGIDGNLFIGGNLFRQNFYHLKEQNVKITIERIKE